MFRISSILDLLGQSRGRKRVVQQFATQGFRELDCPAIIEMLPLRDARIVREGSNYLFEKGDIQILVFSTLWTPRSRNLARRSTFTLLCLPLGSDPNVARISAALREPSEIYSIVDQLEYDSYPSLSPLPECTIFAADLFSAQQIVAISRAHRPAAAATGVGGEKSKPGSLVVHHGRLMLQLSA